MPAMSPVSNPLAERDICDGGFPAGFGCPSGHFYSNGCCYLRSDWYYYGRWAVAGAIVVFFILLLLLIGCINSRRRRRRGLTPFYGTGWMAPPPKYTPGPVPPYAPPGQNPTYFPPQQTGNTFQTTDGFYGQGNNQPAGQQEAIPLQPPQNSYYPRGDAGAPDYAPPAGPPPGK